MSKIFLNALTKADLIDIIAPCSGGFSIDDVNNAKKAIKVNGLNSTAPQDLLSDEYGNDYANTHTYRTNHLINCITQSQSSAIWPMKGGVGMEQIAASLMDLKPNKPKFILGFSNMTILHIIANQIWGWPSFYSANLLSPTQINTTDKYYDSFLQVVNLLKGKSKKIQYNNLQPINNASHRNFEIKGKIVGGHLRQISQSIGTKWQLKTNNKILFIESVSHTPVMVEQALWHLKNANLFSSVKAIIIGDINLPHNTIYNRNLLAEILYRFSNNFNFPIFHLPDIGHVDGTNILPFNTETHINGKSSHINLISKTNIKAPTNA